MLAKLKQFFLPCKENKYRPKMLYSGFMFWSIIFLTFLHIIPMAFFAGFPNNSAFADITKSAIISLTNQERVSTGINDLKENELLNQAAYQKALDMFKNGYFDHFSPTGVSPWHWIEQSGYKYDYAGENLAIGFLEPEEVYKGWQNSFTHHQNLINQNYTDIGVAVVKGNYKGSQAVIVVQLFGSAKDNTITSAFLDNQAGTTKPMQVNNKIVKSEVIVPPEDIKEPIKKEVAGLKSSDIVSNNKINNIKEKSIGFLAFDYQDILQNIVIVFASILSIVALISFGFYFKQQKPVVLVKFTFTIALILMFVYLEKGKIVSIIPHNLIIQ
jgi:uncharacterized protein YkwD